MEAHSLHWDPAGVCGVHYSALPARQQHCARDRLCSCLNHRAASHPGHALSVADPASDEKHQPNLRLCLSFGGAGGAERACGSKEPDLWQELCILF